MIVVFAGFGSRDLYAGQVKAVLAERCGAWRQCIAPAANSLAHTNSRRPGHKRQAFSELEPTVRWLDE